MIEIFIAYGLPASGKTTLLKELNVNYLDLDECKVSKIKEVIESLDVGKYAIDFLLKNPSDFIHYITSLEKNIKLKVLFLQTPREVCKKRDSRRPIKRQSQRLIEKMKMEDISNKKIDKNVSIETIKNYQLRG